MKKSDIQGFLKKESEIDRESHVIFEYIFETLLDPLEAAAHLCQETSTAQWKRPGVEEDFRPQYAAKVISLDVLDKSSISAFYTNAEGVSSYLRVKVRIAHPYHNFGTAIPNLLTVAMGEGAFFSHGITAIKLIDIEFPSAYLADFQGPAFGVGGLRKILNVHDRPMFFGVVKPNVGLDPESFTKLAYESWLGGLDVAKDDEMLADPDYSPFKRRVELVGRARKKAEEKTGEPKAFIANITGEVDDLLRLHDIAVENDVNMVMVNVLAIGLSAVRMLRKNASVPIVAHFDCIAPMTMHPWFGVGSKVMTKLQRLAGCDAIIMPGFGERMKTPDDEVLDNVSECTKPLSNILSSLPVPGGSDWAGSLPSMYEKIKNIDFAMVPGRGVFGHPAGPRAGAMSLRQAWEAIKGGISLEDHSIDHPELLAALKTF
ncbi:MAG: ribulose 1,5-bisphosphate carboxylase [Deltaproteobacteria bacterium]|jgi:ribulose-bisphosphate carboxylase large chain|nr:ribulose 1,5-bisphosphate carboxylase [Deltaproteobacteria bacterium]